MAHRFACSRKKAVTAFVDKSPLFAVLSSPCGSEACSLEDNATVVQIAEHLGKKVTCQIEVLAPKKACILLECSKSVSS